MAKVRLTDTEAKDIMRRWPAASKVLWGNTAQRPWLRAQPKSENSEATTPCLKTAGSSALVTRPDGMWFRVCSDDESVDVLCIEVCGTLQNLSDKRARYMPTTSATIVEVEQRWWQENIYRRMNRHQKSGIGREADNKPMKLAVRNLKVIFVLPKEAYENFFTNGVPGGHEFFLEHSSLASFSSPKMQDFLRRLAPSAHFYRVV